MKHVGRRIAASIPDALRCASLRPSSMAEHHRRTSLTAPDAESLTMRRTPAASGRVDHVRLVLGLARMVAGWGGQVLDASQRRSRALGADVEVGLGRSRPRGISRYGANGRTATPRATRSRTTTEPNGASRDSHEDAGSSRRLHVVVEAEQVRRVPRWAEPAVRRCIVAGIGIAHRAVLGRGKPRGRDSRVRRGARPGASRPLDVRGTVLRRNPAAARWPDTSEPRDGAYAVGVGWRRAPRRPGGRRATALSRFGVSPRRATRMSIAPSSSPVGSPDSSTYHAPPGRGVLDLLPQMA